MLEESTSVYGVGYVNLPKVSLTLLTPKGVRILELITALSGFPYLGLTRLCLNRTY